ncbi:MAG: HU family DNA-binding protein [Thermodesulfobacteriota bacterium]
MNKSELIEALAKETELSKKDAGGAVDGLLKIIKQTLGAGKDIQLTGFGRFYVDEQKERKGRNPQTGAEMTIPAKNVPKFKPGKELKDTVN